MSKHGNSFDNDNPHHLYEIRDNKFKDLFKYGISDEPIDEDGLLSRVRKQVNFLNLAVGWIRFAGKILIKNIPGRRKAKEVEKKHINKYIEKHGKRPREFPLSYNIAIFTAASISRSFPTSTTCLNASSPRFSRKN